MYSVKYKKNPTKLNTHKRQKYRRKYRTTDGFDNLVVHKTLDRDKRDNNY